MASKGPFAARVAAGLRARGLTLRGLCREAGLDASFFSKVLAGKRSPPSDEALLRRIAQALGLDAVELIVAAGRIPAEWGALWEDAELFREVHARAAGGGQRPGDADGSDRRGRRSRPQAMGPIGGRTRPPESDAEPLPELPPREGLSEELL
ncbi:MAG: helix-turn-helix domain-containing protein [Elusimicrobia bacterium]|nr:helix-turn-helix domain-containing protein [Elusimicrobiota bacterium]